MCTELSIEHFAEHGQVAYCQRFLDAMPKNYLRRTAYLKWLAAFSPLDMNEGGKLCKDTGEDAVAFDVEKAKAKPFWDFAPDPEQITFGENDVVIQLERVIKRYKATKGESLSERERSKLDKAERTMHALENGNIVYNEIVSLIRPGTGPQSMTLAEAVRTIIHTDDRIAQAEFGITRDGPPILTLQQTGLPEVAGQLFFTGPCLFERHTKTV